MPHSLRHRTILGCSKIREHIPQLITLALSMQASLKLGTTPAMRVHPGPHLLDRHNRHSTLAERVGVVHKPMLAPTTQATRTNVSATPYQWVQVSFVVLTLALTSPAPISHSGLGLYNDHSPRAPVLSLPNPGGFRLNVVDYGHGTERPGTAFPGTFNNASLESGISSYGSGAHTPPGGFIVPESPASPRYDGPAATPPWAGGFGGHQ